MIIQETTSHSDIIPHQTGTQAIPITKPQQPTKNYYPLFQKLQYTPQHISQQKLTILKHILAPRLHTKNTTRTITTTTSNKLQVTTPHIPTKTITHTTNEVALTQKAEQTGQSLQSTFASLKKNRTTSHTNENENKDASRRREQKRKFVQSQI